MCFIQRCRTKRALNIPQDPRSHLILAFCEIPQHCDTTNERNLRYMEYSFTYSEISQEDSLGCDKLITNLYTEGTYFVCVLKNDQFKTKKNV